MAAEAQVQPETPPGSGNNSKPAPNERLERWESNWSRPRDASGRIAFHRSEVNSNLLNNLDKFLGAEEEGEEHRRVLVTLCGKTVDMPFLSSKVRWP
jgi:hypothetical protein